jgi:hypothetical protein
MRGEIPGSRLLSIRIVEVAVHTWDLARALRLDESMNPLLAAFALAAFADNDLPRGAGGVPFFDEPTDGEVTGDLDRLLRLAGREPRGDNRLRRRVNAVSPPAVLRPPRCASRADRTMSIASPRPGEGRPG